jgi:hypothetical protein
LVARLVRDQEAGGSNPLAPTITKKGLAGYWPTLNYLKIVEVQTSDILSQRIKAGFQFLPSFYIAVVDYYCFDLIQPNSIGVALKTALNRITLKLL